MNLLKDSEMSLLNFSFIMIYTVYKMLLLIKNHLNYLRDNILGCFLNIVIYFKFFLKKIIFLVIYYNGKFKS